MKSTVRVSSMVFLILIGASVFSLVFRGYGGDRLVHELLVSMPGGVVTAMLIVMLLMFLLGFVLDFIEITFVVVPIVGPILLTLGVDPIWLGVMIAINLQTSFLTPPFGFALFYLRGVAPESLETTAIYRGVIPFVVIQLVGLAMLALWPELATWLPGGGWFTGGSVFVGGRCVRTALARLNSPRHPWRGEYRRLLACGRPWPACRRRRAQGLSARTLAGASVWCQFQGWIIKLTRPSKTARRTFDRSEEPHHHGCQ